MSDLSVFTILTPVYNVEKFLPACIESVLNQTFTDWELVLVDDGSTDTSGKICDEYAAKYPDKIHVFHKENQGLLVTRRYALSKARGSYYVVLDSDDSLALHALEVIYQKFQQYQCDCVIYSMQEVNVDKKILSVSQEKEQEILVTNKRLLLRKILLKHGYNALWRKAIKASLISGWDYSAFSNIQYGEDLIQSMEILHNCQKCLFIPDQLYLYTKNPASIIHTCSLKRIFNFLDLGQYVFDFVVKEQVFTSQDFADLRAYYMTLLKSLLKQICRMPLSIEEKIDVMDKIQKHPFYKNYLSYKISIRSMDSILTLFYCKQFRLLIFEVSLYDGLKKYFRKE